LAGQLDRQGHTDKHADQSSDRVRRLVAIMLGAKPDDVDGKTMTREQQKTARELVAGLVGKALLADQTADRVQAVMAAIRDSGRSLQICQPQDPQAGGAREGSATSALPGG
jgi:hypothetical protein